MKTFMIAFCAVFMYVMMATAHAQVEKVNPGCTFTWLEPMVPKENTSGPIVLVPAWEQAGDLAGFQWVTNDEMEWDPMKMFLFPDKDLRTMTCAEVGVEEPGPYVVMIKAYDNSNNASGFAALAFELVIEDLEAPAGVADFCQNGMHMGQTSKFCSQLSVQ